MDTLPDRIKLRLAETNQTVADLVRAKVLSKAGIYNVLNGSTNPAKIQSATLDKFARVLRVNREWLSSGKGPKEQGVAAKSEGTASLDTSDSKAGRASESLRLDDDKLLRSIQFLERQFAAWDREFIASRDSDLIAGVYARIGKREESNLIELSAWLRDQVETEGRSDGGARRIRGTG